LFKYDFEEGVIKYFNKFLLICPLVLVSIVMFETRTNYIMSIFGESATSLEMGINTFFGRYPFEFDIGKKQIFLIPFEWLIIYAYLAMLIGDYFNNDLNGFGMLVMINSYNRGIWWCSKCLRIVFVSIGHFIVIWGTIISYEWIRYGKVSFVKNKQYFIETFGTQLNNLNINKLHIMLIVMPILVGIVQSLFQLVLNIYLKSDISMIIILGILVFSSYYSNKYIIHGYSMICRYCANYANYDFNPLDISFGMKYLFLLCVVLYIMGLFMIKRKDIM